MADPTLEAARAVAFRYLGYAARSRAEIARRLDRGGFDAGVVSTVIAELETGGYLDDGKFAVDWVADRANRKMYGRARIAAELRSKGVEPELVEAAIAAGDARDSDEAYGAGEDGAGEDEAELRRALEAARRRLGAPAAARADSKEFLAEKRRLTSFLWRRGFSWQIIKQVMAELMPNSF